MKYLKYSLYWGLCALIGVFILQFYAAPLMGLMNGALALCGWGG